VFFDVCPVLFSLELHSVMQQSFLHRPPLIFCAISSVRIFGMADTLHVGGPAAGHFYLLLQLPRFSRAFSLKQYFFNSFRLKCLSFSFYFF